MYLKDSHRSGVQPLRMKRNEVQKRLQWNVLNKNADRTPACSRTLISKKVNWVSKNWKTLANQNNRDDYLHTASIVVGKIEFRHATKHLFISLKAGRKKKTKQEVDQFFP